MNTTAHLLINVREHFTAAERARRAGGTYDASEGSPSALAVQAAMRNLLASGLTHAQALDTFRQLARDVARAVRAEAA